MQPVLTVLKGSDTRRRYKPPARPYHLFYYTGFVNTFTENGRTFYPYPPLRGTSFHRKEGASTRAPSLGRGCRAQRGGVGFLFCGEAASSLPSPCRESGVILVPSSTTSIALTRASQRGAGSILRLFDRHAFSGGNPLHLFSNVLPHRRRGQDRPARGIPLCGYSL